MMAGNTPKPDRETGVNLGFLEEAEPWQLLSAQFPSKVGGKPAWLSQEKLPTSSELECEKCQLPLVFLLQVYAPIVGYERSFHRTLYVFCCKTPACYTRNDSRCFKVYRSQLPRKNDFYSFNPPPDEKPADLGDGRHLLSTGVKLCRRCGCPGQKACSRCHVVTYCSKEHQVIDWKQRHKKECCNEASASSEVLDSFVFPEWELVTEPEDLPVKDEESRSSGSQQIWRKESWIAWPYMNLRTVKFFQSLRNVWPQSHIRSCVIAERGLHFGCHLNMCPVREKSQNANVVPTEALNFRSCLSCLIT
ncbi:programmed cell death protein 2 isoform X2 [Brachyhypopomus gauderio]|uniref:programmed cell death protein 2 isoform X2 n=1 Tax=Brachyhypopomus gauderio TaxID=698409 RepID=UPI004041DB3C